MYGDQTEEFVFYMFVNICPQRFNMIYTVLLLHVDGSQ